MKIDDKCMKRNRETGLPFSAKLFLLGILTKPFYILPSGMPQIGDFLILLSYLLLLASGNMKPITKEEKILRTFVVLVALINGIYFIFFPDLDFILSTFYYIFNFLVVLSFKSCFVMPGFGKALERVLELSLLIQLFVYQTGRGRWYHLVRYMGTFNDPNQYAFFIFGAMLLIFLIKNAYGDVKKTIIWYILAFYLMMPASSTGMLLGFVVFLIFFVMFSLQVSTGRVLGMLFFIFLGIALFVMYSNGMIRLPASFENSFMAQRLNQKLSGVSDDPVAIANDRQWTKLIYYPVYILFGAGEGHFVRFPLAGTGSEIHSSIFGPLWYYGILPFVIWMRWCFKKIKRVDRIVLCVYAGLMVECITLVNNRQPFFWMIFAMADFKRNNRSNDSKRLEPQYENAIYT